MKPGPFDSNPALRYHETVQQILGEIVETQMDSMRRVACLVAETVRRDGIVYTLGSGHSLLIAAELYFRAGGLVNFDVIHDKTFGRAERLSGYAEVLLDSYPISARDLLIIVSNSGRNCLPVELAMEACKRGIPTVAITSLKHSQAVSSRLPGGIRLYEVSDLVIDNCGVPGDSALELGDEPSFRVGPTSTLAGIFIVHCIVSMAVSQLLESGVEPPVFVSANLDEGDRKNQRLVEFMRQRIRGL